ncbi:MAG: alanine racemase [Ignavibacteriaceae bacterium]|nr:alanine racemase [Ignavibacteriaceae bacterium]
MLIYDLDTPCLLLDYDAMLANITNTHTFIINKGKEIRSHVKAHKCSQLAEIQIKNGAHGLCTATLSEAEKLFKKGFDNILITRPIAEKIKIQKVIQLTQESKNIFVVVDNENTAAFIDELNSNSSLPVQIFLDIDVGFGRTGFQPDSVIQTALNIQNKKNLVIKGIQAYHGNVQHIQKYEDRKTQTLSRMQIAADIFCELKKKGFELSIFSGGGTGSHAMDVQIKELTELQIGSYLLMDAQYLEVDLYGESSYPNLKPALFVLSTVISANNKNYFTVDAGLKSIYRDSPNPIVLNETNEQLKYEWFGDEFGKIIAKVDDSNLKLGSKLKIIPSHCDPTINLYDKVYLFSDSKVLDTFEIDLRGCNQ